jgi:hypothetical protein
LEGLMINMNIFLIICLITDIIAGLVIVLAYILNRQLDKEIEKLYFRLGEGTKEIGKAKKI